MMNANQIKVKLIDYFLKEIKPDLVASEVSFYHGHRKADLIYLNSEGINAFEIKSDKDTLSKLSEQLTDYVSTFSFCYLVTTSMHLKKARNLVPSRVGIILVKENGIQVLRRPVENRRLSKHSLTMGLSVKQLRELSGVIDKNLALDFRRQYIEKKTSTSSLKKYFFDSLIEKHQKKYQNFQIDRGERTTLTDLYYLQNSF